ncbi:MAG: glycosyl transferase family 2 [Holophagaceae bacterium]|nr:glycosyl transferase family 2 [Holophagaceae bacterium]
MELATAIGLGVFLGALPIIPFGIALILYVHHRLHLNKLAGVAASNVCVAPFVPFLCIQVGYFMRQGRWWTDYSRHSLLNEIPLRLLEWALGSLVVGPLLGLALAVPSYFIVKAWRR